MSKKSNGCIVRIYLDIEANKSEENGSIDIECKVVSRVAKKEHDEAGAGRSHGSPEMAVGQNRFARRSKVPNQVGIEQSADGVTAVCHKSGTGDFEKPADIEELPQAIGLAMAKALSIQESINHEDLEWLRKREDLDQNTRNEVFARMAARGGLFLNLVEKLIGFGVGYDRLPTVDERLQTDVPRFIPREK